MNTLKTWRLRFNQSSPLSNKQANNSFPLALLGFAQICSWGTLYYSFPQLAQALITEYAWLKSDVYLALTLCLLFSSFAAVPLGSLIDKGYGRNVMAFGSVVAGVLLLLVSQIEALIGLYLIFIGIGITQAATLYDAAFSVINNNYKHQQAKSKIITLTLWGGFASTLFIPIIEVLITEYGWRATFIVLGAVNLFVCTAIYSLLPKGQVQQVKHQSNQLLSHNVKWATKQPVFWALLVCFALFAAGASTFKFHLYPFLLERNFSTQEVVLMLAVMGPAQVIGRVVIKLIGNKVTAMHLGVLTTAALPVTFFSLVYLPDELWLFICFIGLFSIASGMMTIVKGIAIPELLTKQAYGAINGAMSIPITMIKAAAPALAALLWMATLSYDLVLILLGSISVLAVLSFALVKSLARYTQG